MGLDMYLNARRSVNCYDSEDEEQKALQSLPLNSETGMLVSAIEYRAMYWRKANAIHRWFVENVQDGADDCGMYDVSPQHLQLLRDTCQQVLDYPNIAPKLLPSQAGFFFGGLDYGEEYLGDLRLTVTGLDKALQLASSDKWIFFTYQASW